MADEEQEGGEAQRYRIGAVARLTGVRKETIRVWELRYGAVRPERTEGGFRLYSSLDVERLRCMRRLVEDGHAISTVAGLELSALQARLGRTESAPSRAGTSGPVRLVALGEAIADRLRRARREAPELELVASFSAWPEDPAGVAVLGADAAVLELPTLQAETVERLLAWIEASGVAHAVVVYHFATEAVVRRLETPRSSPIRGPVDAAQLHLALRLAFGPRRPVVAPLQARRLIESAGVEPRPPRFDAATIARVAAQASAVHCECPQHLAQLISGLLAFEAYCRECEHLSAEDGSFHVALERATASAREGLEAALEHLIRLESLEV